MAIKRFLISWLAFAALLIAPLAALAQPVQPGASVTVYENPS